MVGAQTVSPNFLALSISRKAQGSSSNPPQPSPSHRADEQFRVASIPILLPKGCSRSHRQSAQVQAHYSRPNFDNKRNPVPPATSEAAKIPSFATSNSGCPAKARLAMKIDIVKPTPPITPTPKICRQPTLAGSDASPRLTASHDPQKMPMGFPTRRPNTIPSETGLVVAAAVPVPTATPFLTNFYLVAHNEWIGGLSHFWSLSLQEQFYLVWPVVLLVPRRVFPHAMILVIVGASVFRLQCILTGASEFSRWFLLPGSLDAFATGGLAAWVLRNKRASAVTLKIWEWPLFLAAVASLAFSRHLRYLPDTNPGTAAVELFECVFFGWLLLQLVEAPKSLASRALTFRPLIFVGKVSCGIFVFHTLVGVSLSPWVNDAGLNKTSDPFLRAAILAAISIIVAAASWLWMEQPLNRWVRTQDFAISKPWERGKAAIEQPRARISGPTDSVQLKANSTN